MEDRDPLDKKVSKRRKGSVKRSMDLPPYNGKKHKGWSEFHERKGSPPVFADTTLPVNTYVIKSPPYLSVGQEWYIK